MKGYNISKLSHKIFWIGIPVVGSEEINNGLVIITKLICVNSGGVTSQVLAFQTF